MTTTTKTFLDSAALHGSRTKKVAQKIARYSCDADHECLAQNTRVLQSCTRDFDPQDHQNVIFRYSALGRRAGTLYG